MSDLSSDLAQQLSRAKSALQNRDYEAAHEAFSRAVFMLEEEEGSSLMEPEQIAELYLNRGAALWNSEARTIGDDRDVFLQVVQDFEQAIEMQPHRLEYYLIRGQFYLEARFERFLEEAKADFEAVLRRQPEHAAALRFVGEILSEQGDTHGAIDRFSKSLEAEESGEAYFLRGLALVRKLPPAYAKAAEDFAQAIRLLPEMETLYLWRAQALVEAEDFEAARESYNSLITRNGKPEYLLERGTFLLEIDPQAAMADFDRSINLRPTAEALNNRAFLLRKQGQHEEALADAKRSLQMSPEFKTVHITLAEIYAAQGIAEKMYEHLEQAGSTLLANGMQDPVFAPFLQEARFRSLVLGGEGQ